MRTFRQKCKLTLISSLFIAAFASYSPAFAETPDTNNKSPHHAQKSLDWPGIYYGYLPCPDCNGVKTTLALNKNGSYILITQNMGKSVRDFVEKGKFAVGDKPDTIILTPRKSTNTQQYLVGENMLIHLDHNGDRITGKEADRYILRRTDVTKPTSAHPGH